MLPSLFIYRRIVPGAGGPASCDFNEAAVFAFPLNMQVFTLLVNARGVSAELRERLQDFGLKHPNVVNIGQCLGDWDYEITIEVPEAKLALTIAEELSGSCGSEIRDIRSLALLQHRGSNTLRIEPPVKGVAAAVS